MKKCDDSLNELAADFATRIGMRHNSSPDARLCHEPDITKALLAFHKEARQHQQAPSQEVVERVQQLATNCPLAHDIRDIGTVGIVWALAIKTAIAAMSQPGVVQCAHEWGIDGQHSNEYCKKCFINKGDAVKAPETVVQPQGAANKVESSRPPSPEPVRCEISDIEIRKALLQTGLNAWAIDGLQKARELSCDWAIMHERVLGQAVAILKDIIAQESLATPMPVSVSLKNSTAIAGQEFVQKHGAMTDEQAKAFRALLTETKE